MRPLTEHSTPSLKRARNLASWPTRLYIQNAATSPHKVPTTCHSSNGHAALRLVLHAYASRILQHRRIRHLRHATAPTGTRPYDSSYALMGLPPERDTPSLSGHATLQVGQRSYAPPPMPDTYRMHRSALGTAVRDAFPLSLGAQCADTFTYYCFQNTQALSSAPQFDGSE